MGTMSNPLPPSTVPIYTISNPHKIHNPPNQKEIANNENEFHDNYHPFHTSFATTSTATSSTAAAAGQKVETETELEEAIISVAEDNNNNNNNNRGRRRRRTSTTLSTSATTEDADSGSVSISDLLAPTSYSEEHHLIETGIETGEPCGDPTLLSVPTLPSAYLADTPPSTATNKTTKEKDIRIEFETDTKHTILKNPTTTTTIIKEKKVTKETKGSKGKISLNKAASVK